MREPARGDDEHPTGVRGPEGPAQGGADDEAARRGGQGWRGGVEHQRHERHPGAPEQHLVALHDAVVDREVVGDRDVDARVGQPGVHGPCQLAGHGQRAGAAAEVPEPDGLLDAEDEGRHDVVEVAVEVVGTDDDDGVGGEVGDRGPDAVGVGEEGGPGGARGGWVEQRRERRVRHPDDADDLAHDASPRPSRKRYVHRDELPGPAGSACGATAWWPACWRRTAPRTPSSTTARCCRADVLLCATGFRQGVGFLDRGGARPPDSTSGGTSGSTARSTRSTCANLSFAGYNSSFFSPLNAEMAANWIAADLAGALALPEREAMRAQVDEQMAFMDVALDGHHCHGTKIIPFSLHNVDEVLEDLDLQIPARSGPGSG